MGNFCSNKDLSLIRTLTFESSESKKVNSIGANLNFQDIENSTENNQLSFNNLQISLHVEKEKEFFYKDNYNEIELFASRMTKNKYKSSLFKKQFDEKKIIGKFEKKLKEKLLEFFQINNFSNSKLIYLKDLNIPFPLENNLEKIKSNKYILKCIEEIKENITGEFLIRGFHLYTASKENMIKYISSNEIENNEKDINRSFYFEEDKYIGINFKLINNDTYVIYLLHALYNKKSY
jgi:hypothetical protein